MTVEGKPCRHEYVRIFQRRLKGLDRRLVATKAYLPVGFKVGDFGHLSEGSYCFCSTCRKRLFPKRSQAEKDQARLEKQQAKLAGLAADFASSGMMDDESDSGDIMTGRVDFDDKSADFEVDSDEEEKSEEADDDRIRTDVQIDELEVESVDVEDIKAEGVKLIADEDDESCVLDEDVES